jgi:phosphatidylglycerophosphatase A
MSEPVKKAPRWAWWVATGLGSGWLRPAPGTWGSLAGLLAWCILTFSVSTPFVNWASRHPGHDFLSPLGATLELLHLVAIGLLVWVSVRASDRVVLETGCEDPGFIVADEWVGMWVTLWPLRWTLAQEVFSLSTPGGWRWIVLLLWPFLVFRALDIWKPWPVRQIEDLPGGQGIVADDLVAGLYGLVFVSLTTPWLLAWLASS